MKRLAFVFLLIGASFFACKNDNTASGDTISAETTGIQRDFKDNIFEMGEGPFKYKLTPFSKSPEFKNAKMDAMRFADGKFEFDISGDYTLGEQTSDAGDKMCANSGKGQHIHLIVDRKPYAAKYTSSFDYDLGDGEHYILAFLSRSYHESIKNGQAAIAKYVEVKDNNIVHEWEIPEPALFYSRPKGTYVGEDTKKIMLDFYPYNVEIGDKYKVLVTVNGERKIVNKWQPYFIEGLPYGDNTIGIQLIDENEALVEGKNTANLMKVTLKEYADPVAQ